MIFIQLLTLEYFAIFTSYILSWANFSYSFKLILVLCIIPLTFNAIQAWIQDTFLKKKFFSKDEETLNMDFRKKDLLKRTESKKETNVIYKFLQLKLSQDFKM